MGDGEHETTSQHRAIRHKSGEYDPILEILSSQRRMQAQINEINERLAEGNHVITSVPDLTKQVQDQRDKITIMETQMRGIMWVAAIFGSLSIGAIVTALFALILKGHA